MEESTAKEFRQIEEGVFAALVAVMVSLFVAALAYTTQCSAQYVCMSEGTCRQIFDGSCSFANVVSPIGYKIFNTSEDADALAVFTRGVCAPGERQSTDQSGRLRCVRAFSFPDAFVAEIADAEAPTDHERACGRWIRAGSVQDSPEYFAFYDADKVQADVQQAIKDDLELYGSSSDVVRFMSACKTMVINGAVAPSASIAYEYVKREIGTVTSQTDALRGLGKLAAHYCDGPTMMGLTFHATQNAFSVKMSNGFQFGGDAASEALYSFGERSNVRSRVREFVSEMETAPSSMLSAPSNAQLGEIVNGAILGSWVEDSLTITSPIAVTIDAPLTMLSKFLYALEETSADHAKAYLLALGSQCAMSVRSAVTGEFGANSAAEHTASDIRRRRPRAKALGRLQFDEEMIDRFSPVNATAVFEASTISWSLLTRPAAALYETSSGQASNTCWDAAMTAFSDALDHRVYDKLVSPRVANHMLSPLIESLKSVVASEIENGRMSQLILHPADRSVLATQARASVFRIAGAPRTSTFGRTAEFERPDISSSDGALLILLKQAKAVFLDRTRLALDGSDLCQHPPLYPSTERNAYLLTAAPCAMLLPGILVPPFVSDRFDEASLYGRIGFVVAHEIAHVTSKQHTWSASGVATLLKNYTASTYNEAAADLIAADALVATGILSSDRVCDHVSQLWCARTPSGYLASATGGSHPAGNLRGDNVCDFLRS